MLEDLGVFLVVFGSGHCRDSKREFFGALVSAFMCSFFGHFWPITGRENARLFPPYWGAFLHFFGQFAAFATYWRDFEKFHTVTRPSLLWAWADGRTKGGDHSYGQTTFPLITRRLFRGQLFSWPIVAK